MRRWIFLSLATFLMISWMPRLSAQQDNESQKKVHRLWRKKRNKGSHPFNPYLDASGKKSSMSQTKALEKENKKVIKMQKKLIRKEKRRLRRAGKGYRKP